MVGIREITFMEILSTKKILLEVVMGKNGQVGEGMELERNGMKYMLITFYSCF